jgi:hypothetical protein
VRITAANPSQGVLSIQTPENITLVHVSLSGGTTGLTLGANANVTAYGVVAENNSGDGINVAMGGSLELEEGGSLNNAGWGISASSGANLNLSGGADWLQNVPLTISGNGKGGIRWDRSHLGVWMGTTIENNAGWGLVSTGGDAFFGSCCNDQTVVQGNEGGAFLSEASELSIWGATIIRENGDFGVYAEMGSHVTVWANEGTPLAVEGHAKIGVNITANSQAKIFGPSLFRNNGSPGEPASAGVRIDGNSNAVFYPSTDGTFTKGAEVRGNHGPGILVDLNSSVDATAAVVRGNSKEAVRLRDRSVAYLGPDVTIKPNGGGPLTCDLTCLAVTDLVHKSLSCPNVEKPREPRLPWLSPSPIR